MAIPDGLSGYGYWHVVLRRQILFARMRMELLFTFR
jgi:hypothetical protein